ncbi:RHS repeat-associated core domain-containing protein [Rummeliibacillus suwonensis]|uniref:RHS repeat-associated core domain-containing protein n=1 Tax=Rummeliibacillus suwonensis TaxID=1306154 RepID=UPI00289D7DB8|nr:RHS repeat-associated core domain-containing protein [Rummeliibacillus suwonensis]
MHKESPNGLVEDYEYDIWGHITKIVQTDQKDPSKSITYKYRYDDGGNVVEESDGLTKTTNTYDGEGHVLSKVTIPLEEGTDGKKEEAFVYDNRGLVTKQTDIRGESTETKYNIAGEPVKTIISPDQRVSTITYDSAGRQKSVIEADGGRTDYEYNLWDDVVKETQLVKAIVPSNLPMTFENLAKTFTTTHRYDSAGRIIEDKLPDGSWTRYAYDGNDNAVKETSGGKIPKWNGTTLASGTQDLYNPDDEVLSNQQYKFDKYNRLINEIDDNGNITKYKYAGRLTETTIPAFDEDGKPITYTTKSYEDTDGNITKEIDESGYTTTSLYDAFGNQIESINEEGQKVQTQTDAYGRLSKQVEMVDRADHTQTILYDTDAWGSIQEEKRQLNDKQWATTHYHYTETDSLDEIIEPSGLKTKYVYDVHGQLKQKNEINTYKGATDERITKYEYDAAGRQIETILPDGSRENTVYDTAGNQVLTVDGNKNSISYLYDGVGNLTEMTQYKKGTTNLTAANISARHRYVFNGVGNQILGQDPNGYVVRSAYDADGNIVEQTNYANASMSGEKIVNTFKYDPRGLPIAIIDGNGNATKYSYDAKGQKIKEISANGKWVKYEYSPAGYITAERHPLGRVTEWKYDYRGNKLEEKDALGNVKHFALDLNGNVETETNGIGESTHYSYDSADQLIQMQTPSNGTYRYSYDSIGNKKEEDRPVYGPVNYNYSTRDSLTTVTEPLNGGLKTSYTYDENANLISQRDGNSQQMTFAYDEADRRIQKVITYPGKENQVFSYKYDPNGNLIQETKPGGITTNFTYDFMNRTTQENGSNGTSFAYTYDKAGNILTRTSAEGTITYEYNGDNQLTEAKYPNGDVIAYEYNDNGELAVEIVNGVRQEINRDAAGRPDGFTDTNGYKYKYVFDADGYITAVKYPNGIVTNIGYHPGHLLESSNSTLNDQKLYTSNNAYNSRDFITKISEQGKDTSYTYDNREQLARTVTPEGDVMLYEYDGAGNRTVRKAIIQGSKEDKQKTITTEELIGMLLNSYGSEVANSSETPGDNCGKENNGDSGNNGKGNQKSTIKSLGNGNGNNGSGNGNGGGNGQGNNGNGNGNGGGNGQGNNGNGNGNGGGNSQENCGASKGSGNGNENAINNGKGNKYGLYKKLHDQFENNPEISSQVNTLFETGEIENILSVIDHIVNGEVNLPEGEKPSLFKRVREIGQGYTLIGTNYTYNERNQLVHRSNAVRSEAYDYKYDGEGNLLTDGRSKYEWNDRGQLTKVTFPDGFGEKYKYDSLGRRIYKAQFNHKGNIQQVTNFHYKGDTWDITEETDKDGQETKSYTYDANDRPMTITFKGQTFWYIYNSHGDVAALTDKDGQVAARYEYDDWGLVTKMYNRSGERIREGIGQIGDLGTGDGSPGSSQGPEDSSGNTTPDYHPGTGNAKIKSATGSTQTKQATTDGSTSEETNISAEDITSELVEENPYRYAGYYWDRKTQYYYLQSRYYNPRPARFISEDSYEGEIDTPITLNQYTYASNNPVMHVDPDGHWVVDIAWAIVDGYAYIKNPTISNLGWVILDVASLVDPTGIGSTAAHAAKLAKMEKKASEIARTGNKHGLINRPGSNFLSPKKSSMIHVEKSKDVLPKGTFEVKYINITNISSPKKKLRGNGKLIAKPAAGDNLGVSLHPWGTGKAPIYVKENRVPLDRETVLGGKDYKRKSGMIVKGAQVYEKSNKYYYRDTLHKGERAHLEVFDKRGKHLGEANPQTGKLIPGTTDPTKKLKIK